MLMTQVSVTEISPFEPSRWGVWFPRPMNSRENVRRNLEEYAVYDGPDRSGEAIERRRKRPAHGGRGHRA